MARIVLVSSHPSERTALRAALLHSATGPAAATLEVVALDRLTALEALLMRARPDSYQAAVVCGNEATLSALLPTLQARHPRLLVALASHNAQEAAGAYRLGIEYLALPPEAAALRSMLARALETDTWESQPHVAVRSPGCLDNVSIDDIQFVESSKRGPVIHLPGRQTVTARGTLKALYDGLMQAGRQLAQQEGTPLALPTWWPYVMVGSSFIVNLDNIAASGKGALVFADGETIIVPVRRRKELENALAAFRRAAS